MINRIKALFEAPESPPAAESGFDELALAAAALLVEAARLDDTFDAAEREAVTAAVRREFKLSDVECESLIAEAEMLQEEASDLHRFTRTINRRYGHDDRVRVMEMLWQVVYADGVLHAYEANLMRRLGGLLHIDDRERGDARRRAIARRVAPGDPSAAALPTARGESEER